MPVYKKYNSGGAQTSKLISVKLLGKPTFSRRAVRREVNRTLIIGPFQASGATLFTHFYKPISSEGFPGKLKTNPACEKGLGSLSVIHHEC